MLGHLLYFFATTGGRDQATFCGTMQGANQKGRHQRFIDETEEVPSELFEL